MIKRLLLVKGAAGGGADQGCTRTCCFQSTLSFPEAEAAVASRLHLEAELRECFSRSESLFRHQNNVGFSSSYNPVIYFYLFLPFIIGLDPNKECQVQFLCWPRASSEEPEDPGLPLSLPQTQSFLLTPLVFQ